jgi:hypothetical protein
VSDAPESLGAQHPKTVRLSFHRPCGWRKVACTGWPNDADTAADGTTRLGALVIPGEHDCVAAIYAVLGNSGSDASDDCRKEAARLESRLHLGLVAWSMEVCNSEEIISAVPAHCQKTGLYVLTAAGIIFMPHQCMKCRGGLCLKKTTSKHAPTGLWWRCVDTFCSDRLSLFLHSILQRSKLYMFSHDNGIRED